MCMQVREIMGLKVTNVVTADTFEVFPPWRWEGQSGIRVRVAGIEALFEGEHWRAWQRLIWGFD